MLCALQNGYSATHLFNVEFHTLTLDIHLMDVELRAKASILEISNFELTDIQVANVVFYGFTETRWSTTELVSDRSTSSVCQCGQQKVLPWQTFEARS